MSNISNSKNSYKNHTKEYNELYDEVVSPKECAESNYCPASPIVTGLADLGSSIEKLEGEVRFLCEKLNNVLPRSEVESDHISDKVSTEAFIGSSPIALMIVERSNDINRITDTIKLLSQNVEV